MENNWTTQKENDLREDHRKLLLEADLDPESLESVYFQNVFEYYWAKDQAGRQHIVDFCGDKILVN